ncbi:MAG: glycine--tRNA ligase beta subunit [Gemmatimonadota bacterium]|nr:MAG: glycine--tRNA ligase beta subunit [Gemmatimonadota bacterium]
MTADLLYEIGTEEIPAGYLPPAARQLARGAEAFLAENNLTHAGVETHATPRRLVLIVRGLPLRQEDRTEEVTGPPWKAAFDAEGQPTKAAQGFARGRGLTVDDLRQVDTDKGPYVGATVTVLGQETADLLAEALPRLTAAITFPKTMKWGPQRFRFARPIRWMVALLGDTVIPFEIEGVATGRATFGHRILAKGPFEVSSLADYEAALQKGRVVLRASERAERISGMLKAASAEAGGEVVPDEALVREVAYLVETPSAFVGSFDEEFLELPDPVITIAMRDHQRYFAIRDAAGALLPRFLCVANSAPEAVDQVMNGNQRVLRARLDDARFYWNEDLKTTLEQKVPSLGKVVWLEGFGSLLDKSERIAALAREVGAGADEQTHADIERASRLSKADLVTEMIKDGKEFTSLQGVIGREYAGRNGERDSVALALEEQYLPRFAGDSLPGSTVGACLAIADRIDTLVGVWAAGMKPTGSKDPFALRRGVLGAIRILQDRRLGMSIEHLLAKAADGYGDRLQDRKTVLDEAAAFARDRLSGHLAEEGFAADVAAAVVVAAGAHPVDARARCEALTALRDAQGDDFDALAAGFKRAKNILKKGAASGEPSRELLREDAETQLFDAFAAVDLEVAAAEKEHRYADALAGLAQLRKPIDAFFDSVLVMADDEAVRANRLRLLGRIVDRVQGIADLSRIAALEEKA